MKRVGISMLVVGFCWIVLANVGEVFGGSYLQTMWHSQNLPVAQHLASGDMILRADAARSLWKLRDDLRGTIRILLIPALMMLVGGLIGAFCGQAGKKL